MDETNTSIKQPDEIFCPECAKPIKKDFTICPYCRNEIKNLNNAEIEKNKPISEKNKVNNTNNVQDEKINNVGKSLQNIGCLLTIFITIPIILVVVFLVMCGRN